MTVVAGSAEKGFADGIGSSARFAMPCGVVCTSDGSKIIVADNGNHRLRLIDAATNRVSTLAGDGQPRRSDGKALAASIALPQFMAFDRTTAIPESVLYITCGCYSVLRRFDLINGWLTSLCCVFVCL